MLQLNNMNSKKTFIIAEIGTSHAGKLDKAKKLMDTAISSGADAVKFQWVYADEILHPDTGFVTLPGGKVRLYDRFKELEVSPQFFYECRKYAKDNGIQFICSPFGLRSLAELIQIEPDAIKIASPELNHFPLLKALAKHKNQNECKVIISSGVSKELDIKNAVDILGTKNLTLLHCITSYPAPEEQYNLRLLETLKNKFLLQTGVSDHSLDPVLVPSLSVACSGKIIEKHITLSKKTDGLDDPVALEGDQFAHMCFCVHQCDAVLRHYGEVAGKKEIIRQLSEQFGSERVEKVLGNGIKTLAPAEKENYGRTNRSLHFMHSVKQGQTIKESDIAVLRTEKILTPGLSPDFLEKVIGKVLKKDAVSGEGLTEQHITL